MKGRVILIILENLNWNLISLTWCTILFSHIYVDFMCGVHGCNTSGAMNNFTLFGHPFLIFHPYPLYNLCFFRKFPLRPKIILIYGFHSCFFFFFAKPLSIVLVLLRLKLNKQRTQCTTPSPHINVGLICRTNK